jgi:hypothetical protein
MPRFIGVCGSGKPCEEHANMDCNFITSLDKNLKGDTTSRDSPELNKIREVKVTIHLFISRK